MLADFLLEEEKQLKEKDKVERRAAKNESDVSTAVRKRSRSISSKDEDELARFSPKVAAKQASWDEMYDELVKYWKEHGNSKVPCKQGKLGNWVDTQRREYRKLKQGKHSMINSVRIDKLDALAFVWYPNDRAWNEKYDELVAYKAVKGDCKVPCADSGLGVWVQTQRRIYKKKVKSTKELDRIEKLNTLGFDWTVGRW